MNSRLMPALVAAMIIFGRGEPAVGELGCHTCDNPGCANPHHGFYGTPKRNSEDASSKGRFNFVSGRIEPAIVLAIFSAKGTQISIAKQFSVDQSTVSFIKAGKSWSYLTGAKEKK